MHLSIKEIFIEDIKFSNTNGIEQHVLSLNKDELINFLMKDERIKSCEVHLAKPGESIRIVPVKDVIEPRAKLEGSVFPGILNEMSEAGTDSTVALKNCAVVTTGPIVGFQEGIIDMSGPLVDYTPFARINNIVLVIEKQDHIDPHEHEELIRFTGLRAAEYIGKLGLESNDYEQRELDWTNLVDKSQQHPDLPKVAYVYLCMSQGLLHDTYFYGKNSQHIVPTLIHPGEVFDGAIVSGNCVSPGSKTTTWHHQNNAVIQECLERDGKEINFMGIVLCPLMPTLKDKYRNTMKTAQIVQLMGAEGCVISQEGFGNPTSDLMMTARNLEKKGIKTVLISNEDAGVDGLSEPLPDGTIEADAIVSTGNSNATIELPPMDQVIGHLKDIERVTGGFVGSIQEDGSLIIEIHGIMGSHNLQGHEKLCAVTV